MPIHRILYVDRDSLSRREVSRELGVDPELEVAATASNGTIALKKLQQISVNAVLINPELSDMVAERLVSRIQQDFPTMSLVVVLPPRSKVPPTLLDVPVNVIERSSDEQDRRWVRNVVGVLSQSVAANDSPPLMGAASSVVPLSGRAKGEDSSPAVLAIGCSTGGPKALEVLLPSFPTNLRVPVLVVQHMPASFTHRLASQLDRNCNLPVYEAEHGMPLQPGVVYFAPGDYHMVIQRDGVYHRLALHQGPKVNSCRPAVDVLFESVARVYGAAALAAVLTGMGADGYQGARAIVEAGGRVVVQDKATSVVWGMPGYIADEGLAEAVLPLDKIGERLVSMVGHRRGVGARRKAGG